MGLTLAAKADAHTLDLRDDGIGLRLARACYGTWFYLVKTVIPRDITALYPMPRRLDRYAPPFAAECPGDPGDQRRPARAAAAPARAAGGLAELPGAPGTQLGTRPDRPSTRRGPVQLSVHGRPGGAAGRRPGPRLGGRPRRARAVAIIAVGAAISALVLLTWGQCRVWRPRRPCGPTCWTMEGTVPRRRIRTGNGPLQPGEI